MRMTIGKKIGIIILIISILIPLSIIVNWFNGTETSQLAKTTKEKTAPFTLKAKEMQIDVIQVQQFLTDISATRAAPGYDDGFKNAEVFASEFKRLSKEFKEMFKSENNQAGITELEKIDHNFDAFYEIGKNMANVYIKKGPTEGNKMMEKFDPYADALGKSLELFVNKQLNKMATNMNSISYKALVGKRINLIIGIVMLVAIIISVYFITHGIRKNVNKISQFADKLSKRDLTTSINIKSKDEIGFLADVLNQMVINLRKMFREINNGAYTLNASSTNLSAISEQMKQGAEQTSIRASTVAANAKEMSGNMNSVAAASEEASTNVNMVATSAEEMSATINDITKNTENARLITEKAVSETQDTSLKVDELGNAAREISKVTETIAEISEQTNLLALNATIEAARAGEAGKGFAVVANEIKELARQTSEATQEIDAKIHGIQDSTGETINKIKQVEQIITEVNNIVITITNAVGEQSQATQEIAMNVAQASEGIQDVNRNVAQSSVVANDISKEISGVHADTDNMTASSLEIYISSKDLNKLAKRLSVAMEQFKLPAAHFDIENVKGAHLRWRSRLEGLLNGKDSLTPEEVTSHHDCEFGKWYDSPDGQKLKNISIFNEVGKHHEKIHAYARQIVEMIHKEEKEQAVSFMDEFEIEREKLFEALDELYLV